VSSISCGERLNVLPPSTLADDLNSPVFIVGCPRSGTTFLYDILLSSGKFAVYRAESDVFFRIAPAFGNLKFRANRVKLLDAWLRSDYFRRSGLDAGEVRAKVLTECRNPGDFLRIVMEGIAHRQGMRRWADNTPFHVLYMAVIKKTIPNAKFVHMIRDGRDVAMSLRCMGWPDCFPWDSKHHLAISGLYWRWLVSEGRAFGRKLGSDYLELRYEKLVGCPEETLAILGHFIGEALNYKEIREKAVGTVAKPNSSFPYTGELSSLGRWKNLPDAEGVSLTALLSPLLKELGYAPATSNPGQFAVWRLKTSYLPYWWLRQKKLKQSPLSRFLVSRDKLEPGTLDRLDARWEEIRSGLQDPGQTKSGLQ
jgi:Sulfotransferase family